jgi:hypothetical protein
VQRKNPPVAKGLGEEREEKAINEFTEKYRDGVIVGEYLSQQDTS